MKKKLVLITAALFLIILSACGKESTLAEVFDEKQLKTTAKTLITEFNDGNYQAIIDEGSPLMQSSLTLEQWESAVAPYKSKSGAFKAIEKEVLVGQKDNAGNDYAIYVAVAEYENSKIQFTITFNTDMKVEQFLIK